MSWCPDFEFRGKSERLREQRLHERLQPNQCRTRINARSGNEALTGSSLDPDPGTAAGSTAACGAGD